MGGLFGGNDNDSPPPAPTRTPRGVRVVRTTPTVNSNQNTIMRNAVLANGMTEEETNRLGNYGGEA